MSFIYTKIFSVIFILFILVYFGIKYFYPQLTYSVERKANSLYYNSKLLMFIIIVSIIIIYTVYITESNVEKRIENFNLYNSILTLLVCQIDVDAFEKLPDDEEDKKYKDVKKEEQNILLQEIANEMMSGHSVVKMDFKIFKKPDKFERKPAHKTYDLKETKDIGNKPFSSIYKDPQVQAYITKELGFYASIIDNKNISNVLLNASSAAQIYLIVKEIQKNAPNLQFSDICKFGANLCIASNAKTYPLALANAFIAQNKHY